MASISLTWDSGSAVFSATFLASFLIPLDVGREFTFDVTPETLGAILVPGRLTPGRVVVAEAGRAADPGLAGPELVRLDDVAVVFGGTRVEGVGREIGAFVRGFDPDVVEEAELGCAEAAARAAATVDLGAAGLAGTPLANGFLTPLGAVVPGGRVEPTRLVAIPLVVGRVVEVLGAAGALPAVPDGDGFDVRGFLVVVAGVGRAPGVTRDTVGLGALPGRDDVGAEEPDAGRVEAGVGRLGGAVLLTVEEGLGAAVLVGRLDTAVDLGAPVPVDVAVRVEDVLVVADPGRVVVVVAVFVVDDLDAIGLLLLGCRNGGLALLLSLASPGFLPTSFVFSVLSLLITAAPVASPAKTVPATAAVATISAVLSSFLPCASAG